MIIKLHQSFPALALLTVAIFSFPLPPAHSQGPPKGAPFLYRGHINMSGSPATGTYDLVFSLFETAEAGTPAAELVTNAATKVDHGLYFVTLDFGPGPFTATSYWLDVSVRPAGSNTFTRLSERQRLSPSPYAHGPLHLVGSVIRPRQPGQALQLHPQVNGPESAQTRPASSKLPPPVTKP